MSLIVAARFGTFPAAEQAAQALFAHGFVEDDVTLFYVTQPGQHGRLPLGGDHQTDPGAHGTRKGAGAGVAVGAVSGALIGALLYYLAHLPWLAPVLATGVGAYVGSFVGAMGKTRHGAPAQEPQEEPEERAPGVMVAVRVTRESAASAARLLREAGGDDVERAQGSWQDGRWVDFDAVKPPARADDLLEPSASTR